MGQPRYFKGLPASPGLAGGPVAYIGSAPLCYEASGDLKREAERLKDAIVKAKRDILSLIDAEGGEGAAILEFQIALLDDETLAETALDDMACGKDAATAWQRAIDAHIADYLASDDDYFKARAADLTDIRDRVMSCLCDAPVERPPAGSVQFGEEITPSQFLETDWSKGGAIVLMEGSPSSHVAILARARGVPMVTGIGRIEISGSLHVLVDGGTGKGVFDPAQNDLDEFRARGERQLIADARAHDHLFAPAITKCGRRIGVMVNIASPDDVDAIDIATCDGVGLMRSEFLFHRSGGLPDEETQYRAYRKVLEWANGKPVTIRTLDAGGDKPIEGLTIREANPFLGLRGVRLTLHAPDVFKTQLRALARAACHGDLRIMLPMVTVPEEIEKSASLLDLCITELERESAGACRPPLGIMVEVPTVAILPARFAKAAFFSIGSNDLAQYVTAAARDSSAVAALNSAHDPSVLHLVANVVAEARTLGRSVSLCGDAGSDLSVLPSLLEIGLDSISVAPASLGRVKAAISDLRLN